MERALIPRRSPDCRRIARQHDFTETPSKDRDRHKRAVLRAGGAALERNKAACGRFTHHMTNAVPLLSIRSLSKRFGGTLALDHFDLDVRAGEVHALVGQNGSGKSTFIKVLAGFHEPDPGAVIEIDGSKASFHTPAASLAAGLRFVHQDLGLVPTMNTVENLSLGFGYDTGFAGRIHWRRAGDTARARMRALGYNVDVRRPVQDLAAAERTGVAIARALATAELARVLIVDEPTAVLPRAEVGLLFDAITRVRELGLGVIYVSHRLDEVFTIADRVTVLRDGQRVGTYPVHDLDEARLVELMVGSESLVATDSVAANICGDELLHVGRLAGSRVKDVTFGVGSGEIVGLAGLTGSGREEILRLIFGADPAVGGAVHVAGVPLAPPSPSAAMAAGVGFVPSDRHTAGSVVAMKVRENLTLTDVRRHTGRFGRLRRRDERSEVGEWIARLQISPADPDVPFSSLSGGNQQKVVMAKWLRMKPKVLLLDEPTQGVDVHAKAIIHRMAREAATSGAAVVIASSDDDELCDTCDRVLVLRDGHVAAELRETLSSHELGRLQIGSDA